MALSSPMKLTSSASFSPSIRISLRLRIHQAQAKNFCRVLDIRVAELVERHVWEVGFLKQAGKAFVYSLSAHWDEIFSLCFTHCGLYQRVYISGDLELPRAFKRLRGLLWCRFVINVYNYALDADIPICDRRLLYPAYFGHGKGQPHSQQRWQFYLCTANNVEDDFRRQKFLKLLDFCRQFGRQAKIRAKHTKHGGK